MTSRDEERLERMRLIWKDADAADVRAAYERYRRRASTPRARPLYFEFGLGLAAAALGLAALNVGGFFGESTEPGQEEPLAVPSSAPSVGSTEVAGVSVSGQAPSGVLSHQTVSAYQARIDIGGRATAVEPFVPYTIAEGETAIVHLGHEVLTVNGPSVLEFRLDADRASGWRMEKREGASGGHAPASRAGAGVANSGGSTTTAGGVPPSQRGEAPLPRAEWGTPPTEPAGQSASWAEAAEAMRNGDHARAEAALLRLVQGGSDSAELTLAQLRLSQGKTAEARATLQKLAEQGTTPFIRRRASELLQNR